MRTKDAIRYFKDIAPLAKALRVTPPAIYQWGDYPPDKRQLQIELLTDGKLVAEPGCADRLLGLSDAPPAPTKNGKPRTTKASKQKKGD
jgi:hypothetical protein